MRSIVWYRAILKNHTTFIFYIMQNMNVAVSTLKYGYDYNEFTKVFNGFHDIENSFFPFGRRVECYMICKKWMCGSQPFLAEQEAQLTRVVANWSKQSATIFFSSVDLSNGCDVGTALFQLQKFSIIERARLNRKSIDDIDDGQVYATHVLVILMNNSRTRQLQFVFWSFYLFFGIWTALGSWQCDKKITDLLPIHLVAEKLAHAHQACLPHFVCLSSFKKGIHFRFTLTVSVP